MPRKPRLEIVDDRSSRRGPQPAASWRDKYERFANTCRLVIEDPRTRIIGGILLLVLALVLFLSLVSFFFTGDEDQSIVLLADKAARHARLTEIHNILGMPGARLSEWLINGAFGLTSFLMVVLFLLYGLQCLHAVRLKSLKLFLCLAFVTFWGSITLGFVQLMTGISTFFRWGGLMGDTLAAGLNNYMHPIGVTILLVVTLLIFLMLADRHFWEHMGAWWERVKAIHLPKHPKTDPDTPAPTDEPTTVDINVTDITEPAPADIEPSDDPLSGLTIEQTPTEQVVTNTPQDQSEDTEKTPNLDIEETKEVELKEDDPEYRLKKLGPYDPRKDLSTYKFPSLSLLKVYDNETAPIINEQEQQDNARRIVQALRNFDVEIEKIKATVGPTVTLYEIVPKAGTRIAKIQNLENDIMLSLSAIGIRIIAPMPGKGTIGIEVPNEKPQVVSMHSVIASGRFQDEQKMRLPVAIGRTITNEVFCFDLAKTPHLLVAGATGQGKSVGLNAIITSLLYKKHPAELKFVLVDPKMVEFSIYKPLLKHYMAAMPDQEERDIIITDCQKVINTLNSLVIEMEDRYTLLADANCRNLEDYNEKFCIRRLNPEKPVENVLTKKILHHHFMPYLVIIIDEYGDFIMQAGKEVERPIQRLAQKARAVGMHMILATQRPDVKIVTGTIKANIPTRIAFRTQSVVDSRTVLDAKGADQLIGKGDMLYSGGGNLTRIQCAFVDTPEVEAIVQHVHGQQGYLEPYQLPEYVPEGQDDAPVPGSVDTRHLDPMFADVARYVVSKQEGSTSRLQRAFEIGYNRAGKLSDQLEAMGIVGPNKGPKGRDVLIQDLDSLERLLASLNE